MMVRTLSLVLLAGALQGAVILDRIAVTAGRHAIKTSDIERDLRATDFLNREPLDLTAAAKKTAAERLIDQAVIADAIARGSYQRPSPGDAGQLMDQIRRDRFGGSDAAMRAALTHYGLTEDQLRSRLLWQLTVLRFIDQRFRPAVLVTDEDVKQYYDGHQAQLEREHPRNHSLEAVEAEVRQTLTGERINQQFNDWLAEERKQTPIQYRQEAFQ